MAYLPRHEKHRKKRSKAPWIFLIFVTALGVFSYTQEKKIRILLSGDLRQKIERQREKIFESSQSGNVPETYIRDYHIYTQDFIEKDPANPSSHHFRAEAFFLEILMSGLRFDSFSLTSYILQPLSSILDSHEKLLGEQMFIHAGRARALNPEFPETESNRFLLFFGEMMREKKRPMKIFKDYSSIQVKELHPSLRYIYTWLLFYTVVKTGNEQALETLLATNEESDSDQKLLLTERETSFLRGLVHFYSKDYVNSLNHLKRVKTDLFDSITKTAIITEARIFYAQNLPGKAVDLLLESYKKSSPKESAFLEPLREWTKEKPELKIEIPEENRQDENL